MFSREEMTIVPEQMCGDTAKLFLTKFAIVWSAAGVFFLVLGMAGFGVGGGRNFGFSLLLFSGLGALLALRLRYERLARHLLIVPGLLYICIAPLFLSGVRTPALGLASLMVLLAGWQIGRRAAMALSLSLISLVSAYLIAEVSGAWKPPVEQRPESLWWLVWVCSIGFSGVTVWLLVANAKVVHERERQLRAELDRANAALADQLVERTHQLSDTHRNLLNLQADYQEAYPKTVLASIVPAIAHDINTPLGNVGMAVGTLRQRLAEFQAIRESGQLRKSDLTALTEQLAEGLRIIEVGSKRALALVGSLKAVSIDQVSEDKRVFDLRQLIDEVATTLQPIMRQSAAGFEIDVPAALAINGYPGALGQVLINLIQNSIVHGFAGRQGGQVSVVASEAGNGEWTLMVADDGVGMSEEVQTRAFELFFTTRKGQGGSGVGLAYARQMVESKLGGRMEMTSALGEGTRFVIRLPLNMPEAHCL